MVLSACSPERDPSTLYAPEAVGVLVVDAVLIVDQPLPVIRLSRTLRPDIPYSAAAALEPDATIVVRTASTEYAYDYFIPFGSLGGYFRAGVPRRRRCCPRRATNCPWSRPPARC